MEMEQSSRKSTAFHSLGEIVAKLIIMMPG